MIKQFYFILCFVLFPSICLGTEKTPWEVRAFPNVPRISAQMAKAIKDSGQKVVVVDVPWTKQGYQKSHICGAVATTVKAKALDRLIKKIPKDFIIMAYCK